MIVEYRVLYGAVTSGVGGTVATSGRTLAVNGLSLYTNYSIEVSAVNSDGAMGPYSSLLFVVTSKYKYKNRNNFPEESMHTCSTANTRTSCRCIG